MGRLRLQQLTVIGALIVNRNCDLYKGSDGRKGGCGNFQVSHRECPSTQLRKNEVDELVSAGLIEQKYPGNDSCFRISERMLLRQ